MYSHAGNVRYIAVLYKSLPSVISKMFHYDYHFHHLWTLFHREDHFYAKISRYGYIIFKIFHSNYRFQQL